MEGSSASDGVFAWNKNKTMNFSDFRFSEFSAEKVPSARFTLHKKSELRAHQMSVRRDLGGLPPDPT